jgi:glycosyltransferase involved in cell wall biosynthesis
MTERKKVALFVPALVLGGAERSSVKLANLVAARGHEVEIFCFSSSAPQIIGELSPGIVVREFGRSSSVDMRLLLSLLWAVFQGRPDVLIGWSTYANMLAIVVGRVCGVRRIVVSERNYPPMLYSRKSASVVRRASVMQLMKALYPLSQCVTANSVLSVRFLEKYLRGRVPCQLLPNVLDFSRCDRLGAEKLSEMFTRDRGGLQLVAVGRLHHQKGFDLLIRALPGILAHCPVTLWIVGEGPDEVLLRDLAQDVGVLPNVVFAGRADNPFPLYRWADIVVVPSRYEGFANVPLEAMAMGAAVVVADCKSGPRELTDGGRHAVLVTPEDVEALAAGVLLLARNPVLLSSLKSSGMSHVRSHYGEERVASYCMSVLEVG